MKNEPTRSMPSQLILGIFVIGIGLLFLLDNLDIFDFRRAISFWPAVFILIGVIKLVDTSSPNRVPVGLAFIGFGVALTLDRLGYIDFDWRNIWPLAIIFVGGMVVYRALSARKGMDQAMVGKPDEGSDAIVDITAILGGFERRIATPHFRGGEITAVMGGCQLDLRNASIEGEAVIHVFAAMGGITLKVPPDWTVVLHGTPIIGGFDEKTATPPHGDKRLIIKGYAIMGGVEVRN